MVRIIDSWIDIYIYLDKKIDRWINQHIDSVYINIDGHLDRWTDR